MLFFIQKQEVRNDGAIQILYSTMISNSIYWIVRFQELIIDGLCADKNLFCKNEQEMCTTHSISLYFPGNSNKCETNLHSALCTYGTKNMYVLQMYYSYTSLTMSAVIYR